jgi:hypothetical protein
MIPAAFQHAIATSILTAVHPSGGQSGEANRHFIVSHRQVLSVPKGDRPGRSAGTRQRRQTSDSLAVPLAKPRAGADNRPIATLLGPATGEIAIAL